ncbi:MAG TPA: penicillin-binding transpeptidase domain-containing protein [Actinomycetota bacterium]|nr:penicillin-binding transpeptidase domain-containing protein [Actinomycetota bacterium]
MTRLASPPRRRTNSGAPARRRLRLLQVAILAVGVTLGARLVWLQTAESPVYAARADRIQTDLVDVPAARGDIVDRNGVILVGNRTAYEVQVDATIDEDRLPELARLGATTPQRIAARMLVCGQPGAQAGTCYRGEPGAPIPVLTDVPIARALAIQDAALPGVHVMRVAVRDYPSPANAAGLLGYLGEGHGRSGLEAQYDEALSGIAGQARREFTRRGDQQQDVLREPQPGQTLVTTLDAGTQAVAEQALRDAVEQARQGGYRATGGSVVVMDADTGAIVALASYPTYDPDIWVRGITDAQYATLTDEKGGRPLVFRPTQAVAPPASTFKSLTTVAAARAGFDLAGQYDCPASVTVGGQTFRNYESRAYGSVSLARALSVSCDTVFYRLGYRMWKRDGGLDGSGAREYVVRTADDFGLGSLTGVDLPGEAAGSIPDRGQVLAEYDARRDDYCRRARTGYPEEPDAARAKLLKAYALDYCRSGFEYRAGDAMNTAIGQGRTLVTPLQMAAAYAAIANGGTLVTPHLGAELRGDTATDIAPGPRGELTSDQVALDYVRRALATTTTTGTASGAFAGFPLRRYPVAAKTGTAEVAGRQSTSWFASFAPADDPRYVVVVNVDQGGLGAATSGPVARTVYEHLFGVSP